MGAARIDYDVSAVVKEKADIVAIVGESALQYLAERYNIELPKKSISKREQEQKKQKEAMFAVSKKVASIYSRSLLGEEYGEAARDYLANRGLSPACIKRFGLGYAPSKDVVGWNYLGAYLSRQECQVALQAGLLVKNERGGEYDRFRDRILFPIHDNRGRICGFGGRILGEGQPKYMNSPESLIFNKGSNLLGLYHLRDSLRKRRMAVVVEGNFDLLTMVDKGYDNVVAPLGTALTSDQVALLKRHVEEVVLLFDGDAAGVRASLRAAPLFLRHRMRAKVALLPTGEDPDTYVRTRGPEAMGDLIENAFELGEFVLDRLVAEHGMSLEGKSRIVEELVPLVDASASN
ncbi:unnamed protein product, partial [Cyprideis torosa]